MKKVVMFVILAALLTVPAAALEEDAPRGVCGDEIAWILEGNTLTISGYGEMYDYVESPPWEEYRQQIQKVVFAGEVSYVGAYAFEDYDSITEVDFGEYMKTLGIRSFADCDGLERIHMPSTFRVFGEESLRNCKNLKAIHCDGTFPSFRLNCLWQTETKIYYPASRPWPVSLVQELEEAFSYRIEFLDSDGNDPYTPEEATEETTEATQPETTIPETTVPETTVPETTVPETTVPVTTQPPATEAAQPETTLPETSAPPPVWTTAAPTEAPVRKSSGGKVGAAIVVLVLSAAGVGALVFRRGGKKHRYE